jgi:hypothetical protein
MDPTSVFNFSLFASLSLSLSLYIYIYIYLDPSLFAHDLVHSMHTCLYLLGFTLANPSFLLCEITSIKSYLTSFIRASTGMMVVNAFVRFLSHIEKI